MTVVTVVTKSGGTSRNRGNYSKLRGLRSHWGSSVTTSTGGTVRPRGPCNVSKSDRERDNFDRRNRETAREILDHPGAHGGPEAFPSIWARLCIARLEPAERAEAA